MWDLSYPDWESFAWLQQVQMLEVRIASHRPVKGMMGLPCPAIKRGFSAANVALGFWMEVSHAN